MFSTEKRVCRLRHARIRLWHSRDLKGVGGAPSLRAGPSLVALPEFADPFPEVDLDSVALLEPFAEQELSEWSVFGTARGRKVGLETGRELVDVRQRRDVNQALDSFDGN